MKKYIKSLSLITVILVLLISGVLPDFIQNKVSKEKTVNAIPQGSEERGIWINKYEFVLYNNVLETETEERVLSDGNTYTIRRGGDVFTNEDFLSLGGGNDYDITLDEEESISVGNTYINDDTGRCATITLAPSGGAGTMSSTCNGQNLSGIPVIMERTELHNIEGYVNGDEITLPWYISHVGGIPNNPEEGSSVNGRLSFGIEDVFEKTDGVDPANTGYAKRQFVDCAGGDCYGLRGEDDSPGNVGGTWAVKEGGGNNPTIYQMKRDDAGGGCSGDCSATTVVKFRGVKDRQYDRQAQIDAATRFQVANVKRVAFRDFFNPDRVNRVINQCGSILSFTPSEEYIIDTLVNPIPGPFLDCVNDLFSDNDTFNEINAIEGIAQTGPDYLNSAAEDSCGSGGIPIITDLSCYLTKWVFDIIFDLFTSVINWLASPPDMFAEQNSTLEQAISNLRNIANIIFVIAFLLVVFQYMTNINVVDAYFVKKFIPRLVIAVILVQASFFITAELNYFFYDLGKSVQTIVFFGQSPGDLQITNGVATIAAFAGPAYIGMALLIGLVMLLVLIITMIVLAIRYILIIVLAIFAPLAFAALAIPQLEGVSKKWFNMYIKLLLMYPIIMFFIAASSIIGGVFSGGGIVLQIFAIVVQFLPFIILPFTFKMSGGLMGSISSKVLSAPKRAYGAYKKGEGLYESKTQAGRSRAAERKLKEGIKSDRASNAASDRLSGRMRGTMSPWARRRTFGAGATDQEVDKYRGIFEDRENKRKAEEAKAALDTKLKTAPNRDEAVRILNDEYHAAMASGDTHTADAAFAGLVGQQAHSQLKAIQEEAHSGAIDTAVYNRQQGANYGDLKAFAPHLAGDVGAGVDLDAQRANNLATLSNDQLAGVKKEAWQEWASIDPVAAAKRYASILQNGGGPAGKLNPEAKGVLGGHADVQTKLNESDADIAARVTSIDEQREATKQRDLLKDIFGT